MTRTSHQLALALATAGAATLGLATLGAQDRLKAMPGYDQYSKMAPQVQGAWISGAVAATWADDGKSFTYANANKLYKFDLATMTPAVAGDAPAAAGNGRGGRGARGGGAPPPAAAGQQVAGRGAPPAGRGTPPPGRGGRSGGMEQEQTEMTATRHRRLSERVRPRAAVRATASISPDGKLKAFYRDRNLWVANFDGTNEKQVTTDGSEKKRIKYGTGSWVYGEELGADDGDLVVARQHEGRLLPLRREPGEGFLPADEPDAGPGHARRRGVSEGRRAESDSPTSSSTTSRRPKSTQARRARRQAVQQRRRRPLRLRRAVVAGRHASCSINRTNRRQNIMEFVGVQPGDRQVPRRRSARNGRRAGSTNRPADAVPQADNKRFIWESERNGFRNYYLYDLTGKLINPITSNTTFESGDHRQARRGDQRAVLHGARRRQLHEDAAAPRRPRRQGRRAADRSGVQPHRRRRAWRTAAAGAAAVAAAARRRRRQRAASRRTTSTSSTSIRRTTSRRRRSSSTRRTARSSRSSRRAT